MIETRRDIVPSALDDERVDRVVAMLTEASRARVRTLIDGAHVRIGGVIVTKSAQRVRAGDEIVVEFDEEVPAVKADATIELDHRPRRPRCRRHRQAGGPRRASRCRPPRRHARVRAVGSLPRDRADGRPAASRHRAPTRQRHVGPADGGPLAAGLRIVGRAACRRARSTRSYTALVCRSFDEREGVVDAPIGRSSRAPTRMAVTPRGRDARTRYVVEQRFVDPFPASLLSCRLESGRTHQIRVHLSAIAAPVLGDDRYGGRRVQVADGAAVPARGAVGLRASGHAARHLEFESPLPPDLAVGAGAVLLAGRCLALTARTVG